MTPESLYHIAGVVRPIDKIKENDASYHAGFLGCEKPGKLYTDQEQAALDAGIVKSLPIYDRIPGIKPKFRHDLKSAYLRELEAETQYYRELNSRTKHDPEGAPLAAETIGLARDAKVRQAKRRRKLDKIRTRVRTMAHPAGRKTELDSREKHNSYDDLYALTARNTPAVLQLKTETPIFQPPKVPVSLHIQQRQWSEEFRAMVVPETPPGSAPAPNTGERFTERLTPRAVSKIFEAGAYVAQCHEGLTTFITLTFTPEQRRALFGDAPVEDGPYTPIEKCVPEVVRGLDGLYSKLPEKPYRAVSLIDNTTMGREVSRFLDGCKKMYQRGWKTDAGKQVEGHHQARHTRFGPERDKADFHYIWVAECPANEQGEPNPHVHLLLRWSVEKAHFQDWAKRLENLWGQGMAKIQWIKQPKAASTYLIKAVGYAAKGKNADQGLIRGNRYNIARCSRAPSWETIATFDADNITAVIRELGYKLEQWKKPLQRAVSRINAKKAGTVKAAGIAKQKGEPEDKLKKLQGRIIRCEKAAMKISAELKSRHMHAASTNRFCLTFDGEKAEDRMNQFLVWAAGARGWSMQCRDADISSYKKWADWQYKAQFERFQEKQAWWQNVYTDPVREAPCESEMRDWLTLKHEQYQQWAGMH